jgi:uncharacterized protein (DUF305 family)
MSISNAKGICAFALFVVASACSDGSSGEDVDESDARLPYEPQNDVEFIDGMIPHHEMAIMMADMELEHGVLADVRAMAQQMKDAQSAEIAVMMMAREELTGSEEPPELMNPHMELDMMEMMSARGEEMDRSFLTHMIPHHASAIQMAHDALPHLERQDMKQMANQIVEDQAAEIGDIHEMLASP